MLYPQIHHLSEYERIDLLLTASFKQGGIDSAKCNELVRCELTEPLRIKAFGITENSVTQAIVRRASLFSQLIESDILKQLPLFDQNQTIFLRTLWRFWLPLAINLADIYHEVERPFVQGVLGGQGTGKTTLAKALILILENLGLKTIAISIDDLYKSYAERQQLKQIDPRFIRRGPPGTHNVQQGLKLLDQIKKGQFPVEIPQFNKSLFAGDGDQVAPHCVEQADLVIFEGWFVGVQPIHPERFTTAPVPILTEDDRQFARDCNTKLHDYLPLWQYLDQLIILDPVDYRLSKQWRLQAEQDLIATEKAGMTHLEVEEFVNYFWKALHPELFISPLTQKPNSKFVKMVVKIEANHQVGEIYS